MNNTARGVVPLLGFAVSTAVLDVYAGYLLQAHNPVTVAAISFTVVAGFFLASDMVLRGVTATLAPWRVSRNDVLAINVVTAVSWLSALYALKYLEPAVVGVAVFALELVFMLPLSPLMRPGTVILRTEIVVTAGFCLLIGVLGWESFSGHSAVGKIGLTAGTAGAVMIVVSALSGTATVIYAKRLSDAGHGPRSVLAVRFFAMIAVTWITVAVTGDPKFVATIGPSVILAAVGVGLPIYLFQVGIKHAEPITAELISTLAPVFTFILQFFNTRLSPSLVTLAAIVGIVALTFIGTAARYRYDKRTSSVESVKEPTT